MMQSFYWRKYLLWALVVLAAATGAYLLYKNVRLAGPEEFPIATGRPGGAYYAFTQEYAALLAASDGVTLDLVETAGAVEALDLIVQRRVPVGLVQTDAISEVDNTGLYALGSLFYEPIWIFYRQDHFEQPLEYLLDLEGQSVAIGEAGSGTNLVARRMLGHNQLDETNVDIHELSTSDAYERLADGTIDAAFFVLSAQADIIYDLFGHPDLDLMSLRRAGAYEARYPYLTEFVVPEGVVDLSRNVPDKKTTILATTAVLVANEQLHVDSARQLLTAAISVHGGGDYFAEEGEFPSVQNSQLAVPRQIEEFLELGPSDLEQFLPVSIATVIQRLVFIVLPAIVLLYPLLRTTPGAYSFANRYRVYRWYQRLRKIEAGIEGYTLEELETYIVELHQLEDRISDRLRIPLFYQRDFYNLRLHLQLVIQRFEKRRNELIASQENEKMAEGGGAEEDGADDGAVDNSNDSAVVDLLDANDSLVSNDKNDA